MAEVFLCRPLVGKSVTIKSYTDVSPKTSVSLNQMAERYRFRSWTVNGKQITLLTKFNTILLEGDSRKATFNKVNIWLNSPITRRWGSWRICQADIDRTVWPLLNPDKALASEKYNVVVLDPGHGGNDNGAQSRAGLKEKTITLDLARKVRLILLQHRIDVRLTRNADRQLGLDERIDMANRWESSIFISIHLNAADSSAPSGIETHILPPVGWPSTAKSRAGVYDRVVYTGNHHDRANIVLGYLLQRSLLKYADGEDRGVRRSRFVVLKNISCPAALLECGFLSKAGLMPATQN